MILGPFYYRGNNKHILCLCMECNSRKSAKLIHTLDYEIAHRILESVELFKTHWENLCQKNIQF